MSRHSASGARWKAQRLRVLNRDGWTCGYCGKQLVGDDATVDHVEPIALDPGRTYADHELIACCRSCNAAKGARPLVRMPYLNTHYANW